MDGNVHEKIVGGDYHEDATGGMTVVVITYIIAIITLGLVGWAIS